MCAAASQPCVRQQLHEQTFGTCSARQRAAVPCVQTQQVLIRPPGAQDRFDLSAHAARMARLDSARQADHRAAGIQAAAAHPGRIAA